MTEGQQSMCTVVDHYSALYRDKAASGANQLALSQIRFKRAETVRYAMRNSHGRMTDWVGTIDSMGTTSDGLARVSIAIPCQTPTKIQTWSGALSDGRHMTLIQQDSPVYQALLEMKDGQAVRFSGEFITEKQDGVMESSLGERGSMTKPEFIFRFSLVEPL
jgi:hypothetical protein